MAKRTVADQFVEILLAVGATSRKRCGRCCPGSPRSRTAPSWIRCCAATLDELADDDAVFTVDTGMCTVWRRG
jgi:hypothetical protein